MGIQKASPVGDLAKSSSKFTVTWAQRRGDRTQCWDGRLCDLLGRVDTHTECWILQTDNCTGSVQEQEMIQKQGRQGTVCVEEHVHFSGWH